MRHIILHEDFQIGITVNNYVEIVKNIDDIGSFN